MADSDDEYERDGSRDKFRSERSDLQGSRPDDNSTEPPKNDGPVTWSSSGVRSSYNRGGNDRFGRDMPARDSFGRDMRPVMSSYSNKRYSNDNDRGSASKRNRNWDDPNDNNGFGYNNRNHNRYHNQNYNNGNQGANRWENEFDSGNRTDDLVTDDSNGHTQPLLLNFKQYIRRLDDHIDHEEAAKRFDEYRIQFKQKQLSSFFNNHKNEQWFRHRYHPTEGSVRRQQLRQHLLRRRRVYFECLRGNLFDQVQLEANQMNQLIRCLDTIAIRLEGGEDADLEVLNHELYSLDQLIKMMDAKRNLKSTLNGSLSNNSTDGPSLDLDPSLARPLHKTTSIFLRQLPLELTRDEIEQLFKKHNYLRYALADPHFDDNGFTRKGWISFARDADIKNIYLELNGIRVRGMEIGAIVNKDLARRIRVTSPLNAHPTAITSHIRLAVKLILHLDAVRKLWQHVEFEKPPVDNLDQEPKSVEMEDADNSSDENFESKQNTETNAKEESNLEDDRVLLDFDLNQVEQELKMFGIDSRNPLLRIATDYLIEVASAEEEELLGGEAEMDSETEPFTFERDESAIAVLDKLLFYLRTVHSFDFYYYGEYPNEDEMPNRLGILHVRGKAPTAEQIASGNYSKSKLEAHLKLVESKIQAFMDGIGEFNEKEGKEFGCRDEEAEVEQFINDNTVEIAKEKWLCPLSGKKFKGADFVRKHILNKHAERLQEVREDCAFFNNYIKDKRHPMLPEHPTNRAEALKKLQQTNGSNESKTDNSNNETQNNSKVSNLSSTILNPRVRRDPRAIVGYNDLDDKLEMI